ncbi:hypothetical protein [Sphingomonas sp. PB4P5]|uniref:hypothetical protein n=1 Tax=Parasphingomonas puruogangriensis TaxID=3096155 RepID=UPI002FCB5E17
MQILAMLMLQGGAVAPPPAAVRLDPVLPRGCAEEVGDAIVVCGKRDDQRYRLPRLDSARFEPNRDGQKAEIALGGGLKGAAEVESATLLGGQVSNRLMMRLKLPF